MQVEIGIETRTRRAAGRTARGRGMTNAPTRSRYKMIKNILENLPTIKTNIMYRAELNSLQTNDLLQELEEKSLIFVEIEQINYKNGNKGHRNTYHVTEKGKKFLSLVRKLEKEFEFQFQFEFRT